MDGPRVPQADGTQAGEGAGRQRVAVRVEAQVRGCRGLSYRRQRESSEIVELPPLDRGYFS